MNLKKYIFLFVASTTLAYSTQAMEPLKTALCVTAGVTGIGLTANILFEKLTEGNLNGLKNKEFLKKLAFQSAINSLIATSVLVPALHCGSKQSLDVSSLLKPAMVALGITTTAALSTALAIYTHAMYTKNYRHESLQRAMSTTSAAVFITSTFLFAPLVLSYIMYNKR